mmetsp:Transcript_44119/g.109664  ORF Transcript_44119/g.109664 Transcript_44119/m.109664 type:complete len:285 (+) Transcript_44119:2687-3541(+)
MQGGTAAYNGYMRADVGPRVPGIAMPAAGGMEMQPRSLPGPSPARARALQRARASAARGAAASAWAAASAGGVGDSPQAGSINGSPAQTPAFGPDAQRRQAKGAPGSGMAHSHWWPLFASGRVYYSSVLDSLLAQAFFNPGMLRLLNQVLKPQTHDAAFPHAPRGHIAQLPVPPECADLPYAELFERMAAEGKVCLGLYREAGHHGCPLPFVYTNPTAESIVNAGDRVYVLDAAISVADGPASFGTHFQLGGGSSSLEPISSAGLGEDGGEGWGGEASEEEEML